MLFTKVKNVNRPFEFDHVAIDKFKSIFRLYANGQNVNNKRFRLMAFVRNTNNFSYVDTISDNLANEIISHDVTNENKLDLK